MEAINLHVHLAGTKLLYVCRYIFALMKGLRSKRQLNSLRWPIYIFNLVDMSKLFTPTDAAPQFI